MTLIHSCYRRQDTNLLLKHAIETHEGKNPPPLPSNDKQTLCAPLPRKNEVDFIYGGTCEQHFVVFLLLMRISVL